MSNQPKTIRRPLYTPEEQLVADVCEAFIACGGVGAYSVLNRLAVRAVREDRFERVP